DGYAASWVVMSTDACEATLVREQQSQEVLAVRTACLDERLEELRALTTSLSGPLESNDIDKAVLRAFELPHIEDCNDIVSEPATPATAEAGEAGKTEEELCGLPPVGHYNPISLGRTWVYDVLDPSTQLPRNKDPKVLTVEALEPIGGCKGDKKAYRLRDSAGPGYALRWIEVQEVESPEGYPSGQITWRHRDQYFTNDGVARMQEYFEPARIRLDESCQHTVARATYMDAYDEIGVAPDSACGEELSRQKKNFDWQVVGRDVPLRLRLNYAHKACCGRGRKCAPPPDGPGHSCRPTEGGGRNEWTCDFTTLEVTRSKVDGGKDATYWFAAGVGKVKEHSKGEEIETLVCFTIPDDAEQ
ncbi:MAG: hypothetical protein KC457_16880, partial [Myxococcales bacterium]|nr:hypothetical protein [Myxococcales bacterium]